MQAGRICRRNNVERIQQQHIQSERFVSENKLLTRLASYWLAADEHAAVERFNQSIWDF